MATKGEGGRAKEGKGDGNERRRHNMCTISCVVSLPSQHHSKWGEWGSE